MGVLILQVNARKFVEAYFAGQERWGFQKSDFTMYNIPTYTGVNLFDLILDTQQNSTSVSQVWTIDSDYGKKIYVLTKPNQLARGKKRRDEK